MIYQLAYRIMSLSQTSVSEFTFADFIFYFISQDKQCWEHVLYAFILHKKFMVEL